MKPRVKNPGRANFGMSAVWLDDSGIVGPAPASHTLRRQPGTTATGGRDLAVLDLRKGGFYLCGWSRAATHSSSAGHAVAHSGDTIS